jgi:NAD(P)-dependent dehydrogenase (short-subunit alcohol dehydrogenase family)
MKSWTLAVAVAVVSAGAALAGSGAAAGQTTEEEQEMPGARAGQPVILVTGSTAGLGAEVARRLAADGVHVIVHGRSRERGEAMVAEIGADGRGSAAFYTADLAELDQVRALADAILRDYDRLDVLVNNAGIWLNDGQRHVNDAGHELHFAVNYLAGVVLTRRLLPLLERSAPARVVNVASAAQQPIDFQDLMLEDRYTPGLAYARSKLAQVLFTVDLATELADREITVVALHPATLMDTPMVRAAGVPPRSTVDEGADALMNLIVGPDIESGQYFDGLRPARAHAQAYDAEARARLREVTEALTRR